MPGAGCMWQQRGSGLLAHPEKAQTSNKRISRWTAPTYVAEKPYRVFTKGYPSKTEHWLSLALGRRDRILPKKQVVVLVSGPTRHETTRLSPLEIDDPTRSQALVMRGLFHKTRRARELCR
jgi:hypothetical protein